MSPAGETDELGPEFVDVLDDRLENVLDSLNTPLAIFNANTRLHHANAAFAELWTLPRSFLDAHPPFDQVLDAMRDRRRLPEAANFSAYKAEQRAQFGTLHERVESLLHLPDGMTVKCIVSPTRSGGLVFTYEDITEHLSLKRSYNALLAVQRETLDRLFEGIAVFGSDGRLKLSNPVFAELWGLPPETLTEDLHIADFIDHLRPPSLNDDGWPRLKEKITARLMSRESSAGQIHRDDGVILDYANVPLPDGAILLSYLDVSDSAHVEEALTARTVALQEANKLKSAFIANVSHEVHTPINAILGYADILAGEFYGELSPRQKQYIDEILETTHGLASVINDILDLASIEAGQMTLKLDTIEVHTMLAAILNLVQERSRRKHLNLEFDCPPDIGWMVADEKRLKQVLYNLLSNAIQFTPDRGTITLKAKREGGDIVFTVADSGIGIPKADQARVFLTFERVGPDASDQENQPAGAGLGLSIVNRFVELHGGTVEMKSMPGRGTTIVCRLPGNDVKQEQTD